MKALCEKTMTEVQFVATGVIKTRLKLHVLYKELCNGGIWHHFCARFLHPGYLKLQFGAFREWYDLVTMVKGSM